MRRTIIALIAALAAAVGQAETAKRPDPERSTAATPPLRFESGLLAPPREENVDPPARWREHNDRVRAIGGHAGALRIDTMPAKPATDAKAGKR